VLRQLWVRGKPMLIAEVCEMESNINREATMNPRTGSASSAQYIYGSLWGSLSCLRLQPVRLLGRLWRAQCGVGNYSRFVNYTARVNWFLPAAQRWSKGLAIVATVAETLLVFSLSRLENSHHCFAKRSSFDTILKGSSFLRRPPRKR
jgi:hypothetical protein